MIHKEMIMAHAEYPQQPIVIGPDEVPVTVDNHGNFHADDLGNRYRADSWAKLDAQVKSARSKSRVRVSLMYSRIAYGGPDVEQAEAIGIHGGTGNVMYRSSRSATIQQETSSLSGVYRRFDDDDIAQYRRLCETASAAQAAKTEFLTARSITNLKAEVRCLLEAEQAKAQADG